MFRFYLFALLIVLNLKAFCQADTAGSGRALRFDGVDDYVDLGNIFDDLKFPFTVSAWIYLDPATGTGGPILVSQDNSDWYNGFWFNMSPTSVLIEYGDGTGYNHPLYRRGKNASYGDFKGNWNHLCAVVTGISDIEIYVNGVNAGGAYGGSSTKPMASAYPDDVAKIGYFFSNGVVYRFKGIVDELRVYNKALSETEIRATMCRRLKGDEPGLIGYWNFDETSGSQLIDQSMNGFNGTLKGNPQRLYSGAPIGDDSNFLYTTAWAGKSLQMNELSISNVKGPVLGAHIYTVNSVPSQTGGLDVASIVPPYYGVFLVSSGDPVSYDLAFEENNVCSYFKRRDNSVPDWLRAENFDGITDRLEIIPSFAPSGFEIDLGDDVVICDQPSYVLEAGVDATGKTFLWSTGETSPTITASTSGTFSVEVKQDCRIGRDTVEVSLLTSPRAFSLGDDQLLCAVGERMLSPSIEDDSFDFTWQDGSKESTFKVTDFGTYWLKLSNGCGEAVDSISFRKKLINDIEAYNFISPGNWDDRNQFFVLDEKLQGAHLIVFNRWGKPVFESASYKNNWDANGLPAGVYFYMADSGCATPFKGTLTVMR